MTLRGSTASRAATVAALQQGAADHLGVGYSRVSVENVTASALLPPPPPPAAAAAGRRLGRALRQLGGASTSSSSDFASSVAAGAPLLVSATVSVAGFGADASAAQAAMGALRALAASQALRGAIAAVAPDASAQVALEAEPSWLFARARASVVVPDTSSLQAAAEALAGSLSGDAVSGAVAQAFDNPAWTAAQTPVAVVFAPPPSPPNPPRPVNPEPPPRPRPPLPPSKPGAPAPPPPVPRFPPAPPPAPVAPPSPRAPPSRPPPAPDFPPYPSPRPPLAPGQTAYPAAPPLAPGSARPWWERPPSPPPPLPPQPPQPPPAARGCAGSPCFPGATCTPADAVQIAQGLLFTCGSCPPGYTGDGVRCQDVDECALFSPCSPQSTCSNSVGGFQCSPCPPRTRGMPYLYLPGKIGQGARSCLSCLATAQRSA